MCIVAALGGGVVGVTTAYQMQRDGYEVAVVERNREVVAEAGFGSAGMIAPGHSFVWSAPSLARVSQALYGCGQQTRSS